MKKNYFIIFTLLFLAALGNVHAQVSSYSFAASSGTFTPISGGSNLSSIEADDALSSSTPIGFSFVFDGSTFTNFKASSNGFLSFGSGTSSISGNTSTAGSSEKPLLAPLWDDLDGRAATSSANYIMTGTAPNRVLTMEWLNYEWSYNSGVENISFQVKLYETTNAVEFIYRDEAGTITSPDATIGLVGSSNYLVLNNSTAAAIASSSTFTTSISTAPATGQVYTFSPPSCPNPTALGTANLTATSVDLGWTAGGSETNWKVEYGIDGFTQGAGTIINPTSSNPYSVIGLTAETDYEFYVKAICGAGDSSSWSGPYSFTTLVSCPKPTSLNVTNLTSTSVDLGWTAGGSETNWKVEYGIDGFSHGAGTTVNPTSSNPYSVSGLTAETDYDFYVKAICGAGDSSSWSGPYSFTTPCGAKAIPYSEDFTSYTPNCWYEFQGLLGTTSTTVTNSSSSSWTSDGFGNSGYSGAARMEIWSTGKDEWLASPSIDLGTGAVAYQFEYDVALTYYSGTSSSTFGADDTLAVVISTDNGVTWSQANILKLYKSGNEPSNTGDHETIQLSGYTGIVKIGFYAASSISGGDINVYIDNFSVVVAPSCPEPTALGISNLTHSSVDLGWTANGGESNWKIEWGAQGFTQGLGTVINPTATNPYSLAGLTAETDYDYYVKAICGAGDSSTWTGPFSFTTPVSCPQPTALGITNLTATSVDLDWTAGASETSWKIEYGIDGFIHGAGTIVSPTSSNPYSVSGLSGATDYDFYVKAICGAGDSSLWTGPYSFTTPCGIESVPYSENFATYIPDCWSEFQGQLGATSTTVTNASSSAWGSGGFANSGGSGAARVNIYTTGQDEWLVSPSIDLGTGATPLQLEFDIALTNYGATTATTLESDDSLAVVISTDNGVTWSQANILKVFKTGNEPSNTGDHEIISLAGYAGVVKIGFYGESSQNLANDNDFFIDNFSVIPVPTCAAPYGLGVTNLTGNSADLQWTAGGSETAWDIEWGTQGFIQGSGSGTVISSTSTNPHSISGLSGVTSYDFYVKGICGVGNTSGWAGPYSFTTPCGNYTPTYLQDFSSYTPSCWYEFQGQLGTTSTTVTNTSSSSWTSDGFGNVGYSGAARMQISSTGKDEWLVSPSIDLGTGAIAYQLEYDVALTNTYGSSSSSLDPDDTLAIVISTDNGVTWSQANILKVYKNGSEPSNTGDHETIVLSGYTGVVKIGFYAASSISGASTQVFIDNFTVIEVPTCPKPTALGITNLTYSSVDLGWTAGGSETDWKIEYGATGFAIGSGTPILTTSTNPHSLSGLTAETDYDFYVKGICGAGDSSLWVGPFSFTTPESCPKPTALTVTNLGSSTVDLGWTAGLNETDWKIEYGVDGFTHGAGIVVSSTSTNPHSISGLTADTDYDFYVKGICGAGDSSLWTGPYSFTTKCAAAIPTYSQDFTTAVPTCWEEAKGRLGVTSNVVLGSSFWGSGNFANGSTSGAVKINIYSTNRMEWLISAPIDLGDGSIPYQVEYDVALTNYNNSTADLMGSDDTLALVISTDNGATWSKTNILRNYVYGDQPSQTGSREYLDLSGYTGIVQFGFYAASSVSNTDYDVHIDNFLVTNLCVVERDTIQDTICSGTSIMLGSQTFTMTGTYSDTAQKIGGCDSITTLELYVTPVIRDTTQDTICQGVSYSFGTKTYSMSGFYSDTAQNVAGCDSIATLELYVKSVIRDTIQDTICLGVSYSFGSKTYTMSGFYSDSAQNTAGCDSISTLELYVTPILRDTIADTICQGATLAFGTQTLSMSGNYSDTTQNASGCDSITVMQLLVNDYIRDTVTDTVCQGETVLFASQSLTMTGYYHDTTQNSSGCDSISTMNLFVKNTSSSVDVQSHCITYTWTDGKTYTASNTTALDTFTNSVGCDSIVTLNLTIHTPNSSVDNQSHCSSYTWTNGVTYNTSNTTALDTFTNVHGCDSVVTLNLTIGEVYATDVQSHCVSYTWTDGNTYTTSNMVAKDTFPSSNGCDSIVTLNLTIKNPTSSTDVQSHCDSYTWSNGVTYTSSNMTDKDTLVNAAGCDSIITLNLTIRTKSFGVDVQDHCDTYTWSNGVTYTSSNNTAKDTITNAAGCDSIITLNLTIRTKTYGIDVQNHCDSYTWMNGIAYTSSNNTAKDTITNAAGCDSIITLNLTIRNKTFATDVQSHCESYTWTNGVTYTASNNSALDTFVNAAGCDSIVTLNLTIRNKTFATDVQSHCDSYTWTNGVTYTASNNTALDTFVNAAGCDSIVRLNLTIKTKTYGIDVQTHCDSYTWIDGVTYTASNTTAIDTIVNMAGCDSIVTLNLTINYRDSVTDVVAACNSYTWIDGNTYTSSNTTATHRFLNTHGCDSVITLNLTINRSNAGTDVVTACDSYTWINGMIYTASTSSPTVTLVNNAGCDSVVTLNLTINNSTTGVDAQVHCQSYTWIDGVTYTTSTNTPTYTYVGGNSVGCDSTVRLNLTITRNTYVTRTIYSCFAYTNPETGNVYTVSGVYKDTILNSVGCSHIITTNVTISAVTAGAISQSGGTLTVSVSGDHYRWLDCDKGYTPVSMGDTNRNFVPTKNGNYACMVYTNQGCIDTTACFAMNSVGVEAITNEIVWSLYPNPTSDRVNLTFSGDYEKGSMKIFNAFGKLVYENEIGDTQNNLIVDVSQFANGMYTVVVTSGNRYTNKKLIINR